jgi:hypothetical protein
MYYIHNNVQYCIILYYLADEAKRRTVQGVQQYGDKLVVGLHKVETLQTYISLESYGYDGFKSVVIN